MGKKFAVNKDPVKGQDNGSFTKSDENSSNSSEGDQKSDETKSKSEKDEEPKGLPPVGFFQLFRFATGFDVFLISCSVLAGLATGVCFPIMLLLFGDLTNGFVSGGLSNEDFNNIRCNFSLLFPNGTDGLDPGLIPP